MQLKEIRLVPEGELFLARVNEKEEIFIRGAYEYQTTRVTVIDVESRLIRGTLDEFTYVIVD